MKTKRSGISADRSYRIQARAKVRLDDIFSRARSFHLTREQVCKLVIDEVLNLPPGTPQYVRSYLHGRWEVLVEEVYRHHSVWVHSIDGVLMTKEEREALTSREMEELRRKFALSETTPEKEWVPKDYVRPIARINNDKSCFVWLDRDGKPLFNKRW